jgi:hypothetical protein
MNKLSKYGQNRLIIGLISLMSMSFLTTSLRDDKHCRKKEKECIPGR